MARRRSSGSAVLILLVLGLLGLAVVVTALWPWGTALGRTAGLATRPATATVVESAPCGTATAGDLVEVQVDGASKRARFDGCGHSTGQRLQVVIPAEADREFVVRSAEPGSSSGGMSDRLGWVLLTVSAVAGGGFSLLLRTRHSDPDESEVAPEPVSGAV